MNDLPRQKLCEIIAIYGHSLCDDPSRCKSLLLDFCGEYRLEINVLMNALEERVAADLLISSSIPYEVLLARLVKRLYENRGLVEDFARWGVESWALALGVISSVPDGNSTLPTNDTLDVDAADIIVNSPAPKHNSKLIRTLLLVGLTMLLLFSSIIGFTTYRNNVSRANVTASASAEDATAQANSTATAQANAAATATVIAANPYPSYLPGNGILALYDPLDGSSNRYGWESDTACTFIDGAYHVSELQNKYFYSCPAQVTNFSNFAFEVHMTIIKGDCGGMIFRADAASSKFYVFRVCQEGSYELIKYVDNTGTNARSLTGFHYASAISTGISQSNVIAVIANGNMLSLYVNNQEIDSASDNIYSQGQIGFIANPFSNPTEVVYSNAKVWIL